MARETIRTRIDNVILPEEIVLNFRFTYADKLWTMKEGMTKACTGDYIVSRISPVIMRLHELHHMLIGRGIIYVLIASLCRTTPIAPGIRFEITFEEGI